MTRLLRTFLDSKWKLMHAVLVLGLGGIAIPALGSAQMAAAEQSPVNVHELSQRVDRYYNSLHSLKIDFSETYQGMGEHREDSGVLLLRKPGKMRWTYANPAGKLFVLDGKVGWFYTPGDTHVQRLPATQLDDLRSPLRFLLGHTQLEKEFLNLRLTNDGSKLVLSGVPKGSQGRVTDIDLEVTPAGEILGIVIEDPTGARTTFTFTHPQPNAPAPDSEFVFHPPPGIPVFDGLPPI
jgi:outer membrane lipoprotein carrier protein